MVSTIWRGVVYGVVYFTNQQNGVVKIPPPSETTPGKP